MLTQLHPYTEEAHRGAERMDKVEPGWARRVDPDRLRMWSTHDCVLGQVGRPRRKFLFFRSTGSSYGATLARLGIAPDEQHVYGFSLPGLWSSSMKWQMLADAWRREIQNRL